MSSLHWKVGTVVACEVAYSSVSATLLFSASKGKVMAVNTKTFQHRYQKNNTLITECDPYYLFQVNIPRNGTFRLRFNAKNN